MEAASLADYGEDDNAVVAGTLFALRISLQAAASELRPFLTWAELKTYTSRVRAMARKVTIYLDQALRGDQILLLAEHALEWGLQKARTRVVAYEAGEAT